MKLLYIIAAILAFTLAAEDDNGEKFEDSQAVATTAIKRDVSNAGVDLTVSAYSYPQWPAKETTWQTPQQPNKNWASQQPANDWTSQQPANNWQTQQPANNWPTQQPINNWPTQKPTTNWPSQQPANNWASQQPANNWQSQQPANNWPSKQPSNNNNWGKPPTNIYNDYEQQTTKAPIYHKTTTTTPVPVIKNEQIFGDNGYYKYEYQIGDGTHVGEEGYYTDPKQTEESLVKKGWYSFVAADGKTYTTTYWADKSGYHAFGDHLPTPPPVPAAIQAALDKKKEEEKNKPQQPTYPSKVKPTKPQQYPQQQYPQQQYPQQQYPQQQYPQQQYPQQQYPQKQYYQREYTQQQYPQQTNYASTYHV